MPSYQSIPELIRDQCEKQKISKTELVKKAKISRAALYKILDGDTKSLRVQTLVSLAYALGQHPIILLRTMLASDRFYDKAYPLKPEYSKDSVGFVGDVTFPDNSIVGIGVTFTKIWRIHNLGKEVWIGRKLKCIDDQLEVKNINNQFSDVSPSTLLPNKNEILIPETYPQETVDISVNFTAPPSPCTVISYWKMFDENDILCFPKNHPLSCQVVVRSL